MDNFVVKVTENCFMFPRAVKLEDGVYRLVLIKNGNDIVSVLPQRDIMIKCQNGYVSYPSGLDLEIGTYKLVSLSNVNEDLQDKENLLMVEFKRKWPGLKLKQLISTYKWLSNLNGARSSNIIRIRNMSPVSTAKLVFFMKEKGINIEIDDTKTKEEYEKLL